MTEKIVSLGNFELLIMLALCDVRPNAYGVTIVRAAERRRRGSPVSLGAVYTTLERLEEKDLVRSWKSDSTPIRGGRKKRLFELTERGRQSLDHSLGAFEVSSLQLAPTGA